MHELRRQQSEIKSKTQPAIYLSTTHDLRMVFISSSGWGKSKEDLDVVTYEN